MTSLTRTYTCGDGTPFPVTFLSEEQAAMSHRHEREHMPLRLPPLAEALLRAGEPGGERAYAEVEMLLPAFFREGPHANGYGYFAEGMSGEEMTALFTGGAKLVERYGSGLAVWHELCLPAVKGAVAEIDAAGPDVPLAHLAELLAYGHQMTMIPAYIVGNDIRQLGETVRAVRPDDADLVANELVQGYENETLRADHELWLLGQQAARSPVLLEALAADDPAAAMAAVERSGAEREFFAALDRFLDEFGGRSEGWDIAMRTWRERPPSLWCQLRQLAGEGVPDPSSLINSAARRREHLVAEVEAALAAAVGEADLVARFRRRVERCASYVAVREERALWQLVITGALRHAVLRHGERLVAAGRIAAAGDVLFLLSDELRGNDDLRPLIEERRAEHERWLSVTPPERVGGDAPTTAPPTAIGDGEVISGVPASRGVVTGTARVITDLCDADRLDTGDVLICTMTSPPWTPLFGIAAAVVADSGDIGSHPAIAAREYGIPCVLGTKTATTAIPDGATVTVDGTKGTVTVG